MNPSEVIAQEGLVHGVEHSPLILVSCPLVFYSEREAPRISEAAWGQDRLRGPAFGDCYSRGRRFKHPWPTLLHSQPAAVFS